MAFFRFALDFTLILGQKWRKVAKSGEVIAGISGTWNAMAIREIWGDNYGACKLPTYTCAGKQIQMASFTGYKMIGVNAYSDHLQWAHKLAQWISNEENQKIRFGKIIPNSSLKKCRTDTWHIFSYR